MARPVAGGISPPALWDPLVRISHWGIAAVVLGNGLFNKGGGVWHIWLGWSALVLLGLRLAWGLIGPSEARFSAFPPSPRAAVIHLRALAAGRVPLHRSHNPAGALMVYALWAGLSVVILTGVLMTGPSPFRAAEAQAAVAAGDWSALAKADSTAASAGFGLDKETRAAVKEVHEVFANLILLLACLHVAGVFVESTLMRRNLVRPMLFGTGKDS